MIEINDSRKEFKLNTFSNYKKKDVSKNLTMALYYSKEEECFFWTCEMLCSNMILELWNVYFLLMSKYIHIYNPKLPLYIIKKYNDFKCVAAKYNNDLALRNNKDMRFLFCSISLILCCSQKYTILDDIVYKFNFQIENLYENLKAPNINFIKFIYVTQDPTEYIIPFNELIYHLQETKQKTNIHFWINWIIQYDILCRKKKKIIVCHPREFYINKDNKLCKNIIWIIWDILLKLSKNQKNVDIQTIVKSLFEIFTIRYRVSCNKSRIHLLYHCIELLLLKDTISFNTEIFKERELLTNLEENIDIIFEQIKKEETLSIINDKKTKKEIKIDLYKNIYNNL